MMARIIVVVLVAELMVGTGQFLEIPMLRGKFLVRHVRSIHLHVLDTTHDTIHSHIDAASGTRQSSCSSTLCHENGRIHHRHLQACSSSLSHRDFGSLRNRF
jgi:hypothetical protein